MVQGFRPPELRIYSTNLLDVDTMGILKDLQRYYLVNPDMDGGQASSRREGSGVG